MKPRVVDLGHFWDGDERKRWLAWAKLSDSHGPILYDLRFLPEGDNPEGYDGDRAWARVPWMDEISSTLRAWRDADQAHQRSYEEGRQAGLVEAWTARMLAKIAAEHTCMHGIGPALPIYPSEQLPAHPCGTCHPEFNALWEARLEADQEEGG